MLLSPECSTKANWKSFWKAYFQAQLWTISVDKYELTIQNYKTYIKIIFREGLLGQKNRNFKFTRINRKEQNIS